MFYQVQITLHYPKHRELIISLLLLDFHGMLISIAILPSSCTMTKWEVEVVVMWLGIYIMSKMCLYIQIDVFNIPVSDKGLCPNLEYIYPSPYKI